MRCTPSMRRVLEHDRVLDLGVDEHAVGRDRRVRADVRVDEAGARADDRRAAHHGTDDLGPLLDDHAPLDARPVVDVAVDPVLDRVEHETVAVEERVLLAGVDPPALEDLVGDGVAVVEEALDRVGDLELVAARRLDDAHRVVDRRREEVHADQREIRRRVRRLLDQPHDVAPHVELDDAEVAGIVDVREQDLGGRRRADFLAELRVPVTRLVEPVDEAAQVVLQHVVAEVHHEVVVAEEVAGDQHAVGQTAGRVLLDVGDLDAELRAVADRSPDLGPGLADDDADVA